MAFYAPETAKRRHFISDTGNKVTEKAMLKCHEGTIEKIPVVVLFSGVCKVNAAIAAQVLIDTFKCDRIINGGTAGGMDPCIRLF